MAKADNIFRRILWPTLDDAAAAKWAALLATLLAVFVGCVAGLLATLNLDEATTQLNHDASTFLGAGAFLLLSFFMNRMSRVASVLALSLHLGEEFTSFYSDRPTLWIVYIVFTLIFINGVRGTFAWRRFAKVAAEPTQLTHAPIKEYR